MSLDVSLITQLYTANITHNLGKMAQYAEIYKELWRPNELNIWNAEGLIEPLMGGLERLKANPAFFKEFNPENGWGNYENLVSFVEEYLRACRKFPEARVEVSR